MFLEGSLGTPSSAPAWLQCQEGGREGGREGGTEVFGHLCCTLLIQSELSLPILLTRQNPS